jgi:hypothetical protein
LPDVISTSPPVENEGPATRDTLPEEPETLPPLDTDTSPDWTADSPEDITTEPDRTASEDDLNDTAPLDAITPLLPPLTKDRDPPSLSEPWPDEMVVLPPTTPLPDDSDRSLPDSASVEAPTVTEIEPDELELPVTKEMSPDLDTSAEPVDNDNAPLPETPEALAIDTTPLVSEALEPLAK